MKNRRGFNPDARVKDADFAFRVLSDSVFTKGFLGRSLRENRGLPSVGISSARRSGVPVDDAGKMRCPPGTPNANQFTDINMSNCMVPSAETIAQQAADAAKEAAKKAADGFKRGTSTDRVKPDGVAPVAHLGFHDSGGFTAQKYVSPGVEVISPIDGTPRQLLTFDDSARHLQEGGRINDIPDEHLLTAIKMNTGEGKRFKIIGEGGGVNGMTRYEDGITGALLGVKYPNGDGGSIFRDEPLIEALSEVVSQHFGYEAMPMRLTHAEPSESPFGRPQFNGVAIVTELAHNRHNGKLSQFRDVLIDKPNYGSTGEPNISAQDLLRLSLFDSVIVNPDRHEGNFLVSGDDSSPQVSIIPIDNSLAFPVSGYVGIDLWLLPVGGGGGHSPNLALEARKFNTEEGRKQLILEIAKIQEELRQINMDELRQRLNMTFEHYMDSPLRGSISLGREEAIQDVVDRIQELIDADAETVGRIMFAGFPPINPNPPASINDLPSWEEVRGSKPARQVA